MQESDLVELSDLTRTIQRLGYVPSREQVKTVSSCLAMMAEENNTKPNQELLGIVVRSLEIPSAQLFWG